MSTSHPIWPLILLGKLLRNTKSVPLFLFLAWANTLLAQLPDPRSFATAANGEAIGTADQHWKVATNAGGPFVPATVVGNCDGFWFVPTVGTNWITYDQGNGCHHSGDLDLYFQRAIQLPATNACGRPVGDVFCPEMGFHADNCILEISVNGVVNYAYTGSAMDCDNLANAVRLQLCDGWQPGQNLLTVLVRSTPVAVGFLAFGLPPPAPPLDFLGPDTFLCNANHFEINSPDASTRWFDGSVGQTKTVGQPGQYWATRLDGEGCDIRDSISVAFHANFYLPNAFSPNGDGLNDAFQPFFAAIPPSDYVLRVFDRWGGLVFESHDPAVGWEGDHRGKPCSVGIYTYLLEAGSVDCREKRSGDVVLLR